MDTADVCGANCIAVTLVPIFVSFYWLNDDELFCIVKSVEELSYAKA